MVKQNNFLCILQGIYIIYEEYFYQATQAKELTKKDKARSIIVGSIVAFIIAITPYLFYMYESFPDTQKFETIFGTFQTECHSIR